MVKIHYKKTETNQFLYDTTVTINIDQLIKELVESFGFTSLFFFFFFFFFIFFFFLS